MTVLCCWVYDKLWAVAVDAAAHVVDAQAAAWKKASRSRAQWESSLAAYVFPVLGDMPVDAIASADVMRVLTPIWGAKRETASRESRGRYAAYRPESLATFT